MKKKCFSALAALAITAMTLSCQRVSMEPAVPVNNTEGTRQPLSITPNSLQIANKQGFYGFYTSEDQWGKCEVVSPNTTRISQVNYVRKLTTEEKNSIGDSVSFRIELYAAYDEWDRNANSWYFKVPKGTVITKDTDFKTIGRFPLIIYTTPYFAYNTQFNHITYQRDIGTYAQDLRDPDSDVYIQYEVGANPNALFNSAVPFCDQPGFRADIFIDTHDEGIVPNVEKNVYVPLISQNLKEGEEKVSRSFELKEDIEDAYIWYTSSGHGANEEGRTRQHVISIDGTEVTSFDSKVSCEPYEYYDRINPRGGRGPLSTWRYPTRNWCQGGEIVPRVIKIGNLTKGTHTLLLNVETLTGEFDSGLNIITPIHGYLSTNMVIIGRKKNL
ncbi:MAG: hypothetical protein K0R59_144 [Sphingobacterium sp.]|jgi:hypothetical protein|nr:hypothetical protein [Sphingobacterium sp.]